LIEIVVEPVVIHESFQRYRWDVLPPFDPYLTESAPGSLGCLADRAIFSDGRAVQATRRKMVPQAGPWRSRRHVIHVGAACYEQAHFWCAQRRPKACDLSPVGYLVDGFIARLKTFLRIGAGGNVLQVRRGYGSVQCCFRAAVINPRTRPLTLGDCHSRLLRRERSLAPDRCAQGGSDKPSGNCRKFQLTFSLRPPLAVVG
jgi:hypothetical protein